MSEHDDGGQAFPGLDYEYEQSERVYFGSGGMSLRDYFAAKAMHQILRGASLPPGYDARAELSMVGARAYEIADAMLKARSQ